MRTRTDPIGPPSIVSHISRTAMGGDGLLDVVDRFAALHCTEVNEHARHASAASTKACAADFERQQCAGWPPSSFLSAPAATVSITLGHRGANVISHLTETQCRHQEVLAGDQSVD